MASNEVERSRERMEVLQTAESRAASEMMQTLARHLNCLQDENKATRRRALCGLRQALQEPLLSGVVLQEVFGVLQGPLLRSLADPAENCRELGLELLTQGMRRLPHPQQALPYLMPALLQRLGQATIVEPSEELRLGLVQLLSLAVQVCGPRLAPYLDEMVSILQRTIVDPFPEVKKESCKCAAVYAKSVPENSELSHPTPLQPFNAREARPLETKSWLAKNFSPDHLLDLSMALESLPKLRARHTLHWAHRSHHQR